MNIQVDFWHVAALLIGFIGVLATFGQILLAQMDKRIDHHNDRLSNLEKDFAEHKSTLPLHYQRREDTIRFETTLNAKLDATYGRIERLSEKLASFIERLSEK
ncbi:hypothetical protein ACVC7V_17320 [Hydrogenophaga sp. A37]|uniref:hypothetical protein n=1 Tax=Hydrogenophaga sp. A37 TaxID=1945864 RepID=UPI0009877C2B|nr:hypothetical protein [Hydrogenophaga sp. A37]OOG79203.1 hypothetical protein B0E41_25615 [Hydrogenophaga sp. A37]